MRVFVGHADVGMVDVCRDGGYSLGQAHLGFESTGRPFRYWEPEGVSSSPIKLMEGPTYCHLLLKRGMHAQESQQSSQDCIVTLNPLEFNNKLSQCWIWSHAL